MKSFKEFFVDPNQQFDIAFDLDSVVLDTYPVVRAGFLKDFGYDMDLDSHTSYNFEIPGVSEEEIVNSFMKSLTTTKINPLRNAYEYLHDIYNAFQKPILFITARFYAFEETEWVLRNNLNFPYMLIFSGHTRKTEYITKHKIRYFVEDRYRTCNECAPYVKKMFCVDHPWNRRPFKHNNIIRINDLSEILDYI